MTVPFRFNRVVFTVGVCVHLTACSTKAADSPPNEVADGLLAVTVGEHISGLPSAEQRTKLRPNVTPALMSLFDSAQREQDRFIRANPGEKPPWIEGSLFTSLFEGPQKFRVGEPLISGEEAKVPVQFTYADSATTTNWTDTVVLVRTKGKWLVDDVRFGATWEFKPGTSLRAALSQK